MKDIEEYKKNFRYDTLIHIEDSVKEAVERRTFSEDTESLIDKEEFLTDSQPLTTSKGKGKE